MPKKALALVLLALVSIFLVAAQKPEAFDDQRHWMKLRALNKFERSVIADVGVSIEVIADDFITATGTTEELKALEKLNLVEVSFPVSDDQKDYPARDADFHNGEELEAALQKMAETYPQMVELKTIGESIEGRPIRALRISGDLQNASSLPGIIYMGGHHAREHLSVETPLRIWQILLQRYAEGDTRIQQLLNGRDVHFIPAVNPDGLAYDIESGRYRSWRKNRRVNGDGSFGVDLNRNYSYQWGTGGASPSPRSDTFRGPAPFSEPESRAVRDYVEAHQNITILLSFHTYSQLILYPWGHSYQSIANDMDRQVHERMATEMSKWNGYKPQQSAELYIASGDTTDWSYGEHGIISFTFELDPGRWGGGGFYPGAGMIPVTVQKNIEPVLYLLEHAGNPYGVLASDVRGPLINL